MALKMTTAYGQGRLRLYELETHCKSVPIPVKVVFPEILLGDVNGDEKINTSDAVLLLQYIVGKATLNEEQLSAGTSIRIRS